MTKARLELLGDQFSPDEEVTGWLVVDQQIEPGQIVLGLDSDAKSVRVSMADNRTRVDLKIGLAPGETLPFSLTIPADAAPSFDGELVRHAWRVTVAHSNGRHLSKAASFDVVVIGDHPEVGETHFSEPDAIELAERSRFERQRAVGDGYLGGFVLLGIAGIFVGLLVGDSVGSAMVGLVLMRERTSGLGTLVA